MARIKVNLTVDAQVAESARALGLNMSRLAEAAISDAVKDARNRQWREQNADKIAAYDAEVACKGLALSKFRTF